MDFMPKRQTPNDPEIPLTVAFGRQVYAARKARGWSQTELAHALTPRGTQATISTIENGKGQSAWVLEVCRALQLDPPVWGESPQMERWIAVGRALMARSPTMLEYHLGMLEAVADSLAPSQERRPATPAKISRAH